MSPLTQTSLANIALGHLGKSPVTDIGERSPEAQVLRLHWDLTRDELLRLRNWKFATRRAVLSSLADPPLFQWSHAWQLPADCLRAVEYNGRPAGTGTGAPDYEIEGPVLLSNDDTARLTYIARVEAVSAWDANFCAAFALLLAAAVAPAISSAPELGARLRQRGEMAAMQAFGPDARESRPRAVRATEGSGWLAARKGVSI